MILLDVTAMDWDKLRVFHSVADAGSLTRAGERLRLSQPAISRQISALENSLKVPLFHRHARGLILTEQGELLFDATKSIAKRLNATAARIRDIREDVHGNLRVTTTVGFGTIWLAPRLANLYRKYPDLTIDLMLEERVLDLPMREADVAIRMKEPSQADLIRKRLAAVQIALFATQEYLDAHGVPKSRECIAQHRLICQNPRSAQIAAGASLVQTLLLTGPRNLLTVNNYYGVLQGVINHLGVGTLPDYVADERPELIRVLPEIASVPVPVYLAYPEELRRSQRLAAFRDFVQDEIIAHRRILKKRDSF